jgi:hypothetical protein
MPGRGGTQSQQAEEAFEEPEIQGEYIIGPVSGQRYLIVKDLVEETTSYVGNSILFWDFDSLVAYEIGLAEGSLYKVDAKLLEVMEDEGSQNEIVSIVVEMIEQPSHEISLTTRAKHRPALQELLDQRESIYQAARGRIPSIGPSIQKPMESFMTSSEVTRLEETNLLIDFKMFEIRKEIMDITEVQNALIQEDLVNEIRSKGYRVGYQGHLFNSFGAWVPASYLETIADSPDVGFVHASFTMYPLLDHSADAIYANVMWSSGITGGPWDLTVADTGIDGSHPNLHEEWEKVVHTFGQSAPGYNDDPASTDDLHGHGTHIAGIILSNDTTYQGVAYEMRDMIDAKFGYDTNNGVGGGQWADFMEVTDWAIQTAGADILSLSFGGPGITNGNQGPPRFLDAVIDDLGIPIAVAAGNDGPLANSVGIPGDSFNSLTVGSMNDANTDARGNDIISGFSSRGPLDDGRIKPDVMAPGTGIIATNNEWETANDFISMQGTSMAAPHVAASLLLMLNYTGDPTLFPAVYKALMINHAEDWGVSGVDNVTGWGYIDMDRTLTWMDYHIEGFVNDTLRYRFYQGPVSTNDKATLVWQRHSVYIGPGFPLFYYAPTDLDLYAYEMPTRNILNRSIYALNNVEQLWFDSDSPNMLFKVRAFGTIRGTTDEPFSLAVMDNYTEIIPPYYVVNVSAPSSVLFGNQFTVFANITNLGDLEGWNVNGLINLPAGLTLAGGPNPSFIGNLPKGSTGMVSWQVRADAVGLQTYNVDGYSQSLGETFLNNSGDVTVTVQDVELPLILDVNASPDPQEVYGLVNISALVLDNTGVAESRVDIIKPDMTPFGNFSMGFDTGTLKYYYYDTYPDLGTYTFDIWARDINANWNTSSGTFTIQDTTIPEINNLIAVPSPQEVFGSVNISADVTDNFLLSNVAVEIIDPLSTITNFTMDSGFIDSYYRQDFYNILGTYDFTVWAEDSLGLWNSSSGQFIIQDTTGPIANAGPDQNDVVIGTMVNFDGSLSTDNYQIASHIWTFFDGAPQTLSGVTPQYTFLNASCYDVILNVTDTAGNYATDDVRVCTIERNPPLITNVAATPNPQEIYGIVNVSTNVWDDYGVVNVWIETVAPDMSSSNFTMDSAAGDLYYYRRLFTELGTYNFTIWTVDVYNNWNFSKGSILIDDWTRPELNNIGISPTPQEIHDAVNVTVFATDNHQLDEVLIDITYPGGLPHVNTSMSFYTPALQHFYKDFYHKLGTYNFTIWASDFSGNWNSSSGSFLIVDTQPPTFYNVDAKPDPQEVFFNVKITTNVSDKYMLKEAWVNITDPMGGFVGNYSMIEESPGNYSFTRSYDLLGTYSYLIFVFDSVGNWNSFGRSFGIKDGTDPIITPLKSNPKVEVYNNLNLTATASDNYNLLGAWLIIYYPSGSPVGNFTMIEDPVIAGNFHYVLSFDRLGDYTYFMAAKDSSGNWNNSWESFTVVDETPPVADAGQDRAIEQRTAVSLNGGGSSDNFGDIAEYNWTFDYDGGTIERSGESTLFTFDIPGNYSIMLTVTDSAGNTDSDAVWVNVTAKDSDGDGITDDDENDLGTNPLNPDTDGDELDDGDEIAIGTNPLITDTDGDGIIDGLDEFPLDPNGGDGDAEESFLVKYWWIIILLVLLLAVVLPIILASGRKRKKEDEKRLQEKRRRQAQLRKKRAAQRARLEPPPPLEEELAMEPDEPPPPPDREEPPPPDEPPQPPEKETPPPPDDESPPPPTD